MKTKHLILLSSIVLMTGPACKKNHKIPPITDACVVTSCPSYFGTTQTFTYDQSRQMTGRKYDFQYVGYGAFTQTVDKSKTYYSYTQNGTLIEETDQFTGGTENLYDGTPTYMIRHEKQTKDGYVNYEHVDTPSSFQYDVKKRLTTVNYWPALNLSDIASTYARQLYLVTLQITYDDNDNATRLRQVDVYRYGTYVVQAPSQSHFEYDSVAWNIMNMTYDSKPSPFLAALKYWKFVQGDWGLASNTNWQAIITSLSKNNPLTIAYQIRQGGASAYTAAMTYKYTDHGYPADSYTYDCN